VVFMLLVGPRVIPRILEYVAGLGSRELFTLCVLAIALGVAFGAAMLFDVSFALGAFFAGMLLNGDLSHKAAADSMPMRDAFAVLFFVSVGMLLDTKILLDYAGPVLLITLVVIVGKTLNVTIGSILAGQPLKQAIQAGTSMSQIGEFSFIIATLGLTLKVVSFYLYPIAVGVSVITTFATPYMMRSAEPVYRFLERILPARWLKNLNRYSSGAQTINAESDWKIVLRSYLTLIVTNSVIIIALILLSSTYLAPFMSDQIGNLLLANILTVVITLAAMSPFVWALTIKKIGRLAYANLWLDKKYNRGPLVMLEIIRNVLAVVYLYLLLDQFFPPYISILVALMVMVIVLVIFSQRMQLFYTRIEHRFLTNLNARQQIDGLNEKNNISPWDAHLAYFSISPDATFIGQKLADLEWREKFGINIASIERGKRIIDVPSKVDMLFPYDKIAVIGTDEQLQHIRALVEPVKEPGEYLPKKEVSLHKIIVDEHNHLRGKTIRSSGIREVTSGLVVGIERDGKRLLNPDSTTVFEWNDVIWIVGDRRKIQQLNEEEIIPRR